MDWLKSFPHLSDNTLRELRRVIDDEFRAFTRAYGGIIEGIFEPLRIFLIQSERLMLNTPWPIVLLVIAMIAWLASRSWKIVIGSVLTLLLIGLFDMWEDTMRTVSMIFVCT
ncbi:proline/glycine betaine ABC transporter permease, partial [Paracoccus sp. PXZ]